MSRASHRLFYPIDQGLIQTDTAAGICVWRAKPAPELYNRQGLRAIQSFKPYASALSKIGIEVIDTPPSNLGIAAVQITRSKLETMGLIATAIAHLAPNGWCIVDGAKSDGIDAIFKAVRSHMPVIDSYTKSHGRVFWFQPPAGLSCLDDWEKDAQPRLIENGYRTSPGVFSEKGIDKGSQYLLDKIPRSLSGKGADLGAGWGWLSAEVLKSAPNVTEMHLFEAENLALSCARQNCLDPRAAFHWSDVTNDTLGPFDFVLMNPPFHTSRNADPSLGQAFIEASAKALHRQGTLYMVSNRHLPYESKLNEMFASWDEVATSPQYKVIIAKRPRL